MREKGSANPIAGQFNTLWLKNYLKSVNMKNKVRSNEILSGEPLLAVTKFLKCIITE